MKKWWKPVVCVLSVLLMIVVIYVAYVFIAYHRIGNTVLPVSAIEGTATAEAGEEYTVVSYNIGFGAYESDYGFFMDGGSESWAWSKERLESNLGRIASFLQDQCADLYLLQEVDTDSTRSYHVDERAWVQSALNSFECAYAQNYDSPFLLYPLTQPHGSSKAGLMTLSAFDITQAVRRELPIEGSFMKLMDLDRCYSVSRIPVSDGKELALYNMHLSAYTSDGTIADEQMRLLVQDMNGEYEKGNYVVCGGDFNKDLLGDSSVYFGTADVEYTWAQPLPEDIFDGTGMTLQAPLDENNPVPSSRNADGPYHEGQFVVTIDGFVTSDNVRVVSSTVLDTGFAYSDHNPVAMTFVLGESE